MPSGQSSRRSPQWPASQRDRMERRISIPRVYAWSHAALPVKPNRHPRLVIAMHWGSMVALVMAVAAMYVRDAIEDSTYRQVLLQVHRQLGLLLLVVVVWRVFVRLRKGLADYAPDMRFLWRWAATAMHVILYALLIALPLIGWALTSAHGIWLSFLVIFRLPMLAAADSEFADTLSDYHIWLAWGLLALAAAHAVAALWHHVVRRDSVLTAMLPGKAASVQAWGRRWTDHLRPPNTEAAD